MKSIIMLVYILVLSVALTQVRLWTGATPMEFYTGVASGIAIPVVAFFALVIEKVVSDG